MTYLVDELGTRKQACIALPTPLLEIWKTTEESCSTVISAKE